MKKTQTAAIKPGKRTLKLSEIDHGFVIKRRYIDILGLSGSMLMVYSFVRGFCETDREGMFYGTRSYIAAALGLGRSTVDLALAELVAARYLFKRIEYDFGRSRIYYVANLELEERLTREYFGFVS